MYFIDEKIQEALRNTNTENEHRIVSDLARGIGHTYIGAGELDRRWPHDKVELLCDAAEMTLRTGTTQIVYGHRLVPSAMLDDNSAPPDSVALIKYTEDMVKKDRDMNHRSNHALRPMGYFLRDGSFTPDNARAVGLFRNAKIHAGVREAKHVTNAKRLLSNVELCDWYALADVRDSSGAEQAVWLLPGSRFDLRAQTVVSSREDTYTVSNTRFTREAHKRLQDVSKEALLMLRLLIDTNPTLKHIDVVNMFKKYTNKCSRDFSISWYGTLQAYRSKCSNFVLRHDDLQHAAGELLYAIATLAHEKKTVSYDYVRERIDWSSLTPKIQNSTLYYITEGNWTEKVKRRSLSTYGDKI